MGGPAGSGAPGVPTVAGDDRSDLCTAIGSCNHGFASHVARVLYRDALGVKQIDPVNRVVTLRFAGDSHLSRCEGRIPVAGR